MIWRYLVFSLSHSCALKSQLRRGTYRSFQTIQVFKAAPSLEPQELPAETSIPLTFFDILWLRLPPVQKNFFYEFPHPPQIFFNTLLPKLKQSLSLTLNHFYPLSGHLTWPLHSNKPVIKYIKGDTIPLTVAKSDVDFNYLASTHLIEATQIHNLLPHLTISHEQATILSLQVTLFPNSGFSIGITSHHAVLDGRTSNSFIKSWAYLCRQSNSNSPLLPDELCPFYDREIVKDPNELEAKYLNDWLKQGGGENSNKRSLMVWDLQVPDESIRGLFHLSRFDINKLREFVMSKKKDNKSLHLSTFVLSIAYAWVCRVTAEEIKNKNVMLAMTVDCRLRLEPPLPTTYFGNCVGARLAIIETRELLREDGLIVAVEVLSEALETLKDGVLSGAQDWSSWLLDGVVISDVKTIGAAGSPKFEVYSSDFGWGKPMKVEMGSIDRTGAFCISDCKNGDGVEIGFVSEKNAMKTFASLFANGIIAS